GREAPQSQPSKYDGGTVPLRQPDGSRTGSTPFHVERARPAAVSTIDRHSTAELHTVRAGRGPPAGGHDPKPFHHPLVVPQDGDHPTAGSRETFPPTPCYAASGSEPAY